MPGPTADRQAAAALRRDIRMAAAHRTRISSTFRTEQAAVVAASRAGNDPSAAVTADRWEQRLGGLWVNVGETVYPAAVARLERQPDPAKQQQRLIALVQQIVRRGQPATQVARFVAEAAEGIITTTRRRIHTILREAAAPSDVRAVTRALARLYRTDFVTDRAARIALDQVLRASATFENAAVRQVAASTGREYARVWTTQRDDRVRSTHQDAHGQRVAVDEDFKVGGYLLRYPRDPAGPASETAGCRCWDEHVRV